MSMFKVVVLDNVAYSQLAQQIPTFSGFDTD